MKSNAAPPAHRTTPDKPRTWQSERAALLHRACQRIAAALAAGKPVQKTIQRTARRLNGRVLKSAPARRLALSPGTARRLWDKWNGGDKSPEAFQLNYDGRRLVLPAPPLVRFVEFLAARRHKSLAAAWREFIPRPDARALRRVKYDFIRRLLAPSFRFIQHPVRTIAAEETKLARLRLAITSDLRARFPDRVKGGVKGS